MGTEAASRTETSCLPALVIGPAVIAGSGTNAIRMEMSVLIQRNGKWGMRLAEDVPTSPTMMATFEQGEWLVANRCVAPRRIRIRLGYSSARNQVQTKIESTGFERRMI